MNKIKIQVMCSICKRPSDSDKAICLDCMAALHISELQYQFDQEALIEHAKHIIMLAHEMCKYDSILLQD
jgi:hypothetical protein